MRDYEPDAFAARAPGKKPKHTRITLVTLGPNHEWSADGHDKINRIGVQIWGVRDVYSGQYLGMWALPNNCLKESIAYLYVMLAPMDVDLMHHNAST